jgi:hypothetical protein
MYVDLGEVTAERRAALRATTIEEIVAKANAILHPVHVADQGRPVAQRVRGRAPAV